MKMWIRQNILYIKYCINFKQNQKQHNSSDIVICFNVKTRNDKTKESKREWRKWIKNRTKKKS